MEGGQCPPSLTQLTSNRRALLTLRLSFPRTRESRVFARAAGFLLSQERRRAVGHCSYSAGIVHRVAARRMSFIVVQHVPVGGAHSTVVIPAHAGIQWLCTFRWVPAFAGTTTCGGPLFILGWHCPP